MESSTEIHGTATISYKVSSKYAETGTLTSTGTSISVHKLNNSKNLPMYHLATTIDHRNYLNCIAIDEQRSRLLHDNNDGVSGDAYLKVLKDNETKCLMEYKAPYHCLPRGRTMKDYKYVPEEYRAIVKGLVSLVVYLHTKKEALSLFVPSKSLDLKRNICFKANVMKIWRVGFFKADDESKRKDYLLIYNFINQEFLPGKLSYPEDMKQLLKCIWERSQKDKIPTLPAEGLVDHLALMSYRTRILVIEEFVESKHKMVHGLLNQYNSAINELPRHYVTWMSDFDTKPQYAPVLACFNHVKSEVDAEVSHYKSLDTTRARIASLLGFARNMATHLSDQFRKLDKEKKYRPANLIDIDSMIMECCGDCLLWFQQILLTDFIKVHRQIINYAKAD